MQIPQQRFLGRIAASNAKPQNRGNVIIQNGTIRPRIRKPMIQTARLFFSTPTSLSHTLQNAIVVPFYCRLIEPQSVMVFIKTVIFSDEQLPDYSASMLSLKNA
ncbi:MAG: hypothetical protein AAF541_18590, partial [Pseudomonadota bacterium]